MSWDTFSAKVREHLMNMQGVEEALEFDPDKPEQIVRQDGTKRREGLGFVHHVGFKIIQYYNDSKITDIVLVGILLPTSQDATRDNIRANAIRYLKPWLDNEVTDGNNFDGTCIEWYLIEGRANTVGKDADSYMWAGLLISVVLGG